ncbi:M15 family metallopeptidase [Flavobacterium azooxidireducens]|uniref:D-alanyl-D-alanine dipeptidase n=1 Tax=Flavobacterium azooxidireducens TaxID=1871076 RepID=A0ABY4KFN0_9FLAO|nr:M15 family metallopeptidase [Flavobacterium azooxidireducens]UPQ79140.1 M15 family metallopeptidase [Flavobacterium azooxidireducens]
MSRILILFLLVISSSFSQELNEISTTRTVNDSVFVNLKDYSNDFVYDMRYATENNFLKAKVYDCAECYLRFKTIKKLVEANQKFIKLGYKIKIFDCYRPLDVQKKMWAIVSNPSYVANPSKGSIHNRGAAVDITLVDFDGKELDMGTDFDHFGKESAHLYQDLSEIILNNRKLLREVMEDSSFKIIKSEWWHYDLVTEEKYKVSNFTWNCN